MGLPGGPVEEETPSLAQILRHAGLVQRRGQGDGSCMLHAAIASAHLRPHRETAGYTDIGSNGVICLPPSIVQQYAEQIQAVLRALAVAISNCREEGLAPTRVFVVEVMAKLSKRPYLTARAYHGAQFEAAHASRRDPWSSRDRGSPGHHQHAG